MILVDCHSHMANSPNIFFKLLQKFYSRYTRLRLIIQKQTLLYFELQSSKFRNQFILVPHKNYINLQTDTFQEFIIAIILQQLYQQMKSAKNNYHLKFKDKVVDAAYNNQFIFNKTPILVPLLKSSQPQPRPPRRTPISKLEDQPKIQKKRKESDDVEEANFSHFNPINSDIYSFFVSSKTTCKNIDSVPQPKYTIGTFVLTAIADRGIGGKYLVSNFNRNKKGYIDYKQLDITHNPGAIQVYSQPGDFVMAQVIKGENQTKTQLTLSDINKQLDESTLRSGQIIFGQIKSKEELSYQIKIKQNSSYRYLLAYSAEEEELKPSKQMMFMITEIDHKKKLSKVVLADQESTVNFHSMTAEELSKIELENYIKPGSLVNTMILKVLKNGVLVKFLKIFYGYIFVDHLSKKLEEYAVGQKLQSRIIYLQMNPPMIYLSQKHANLSIYCPNKKLYSAITMPKQDVSEQFGAYYWRQKELMLHSSQLNTQIDNVEKLWIKENNYFERYQLLAPSKAGLRVGEVSRTVPFNNFKVYGEVSGKFRVMSLDNWNKVVKISNDPLIISETDKQLKSIEEIDPKKQYVGFISTISPNGVIVQFQNNIKGLLNGHQIKISGKTIQQYKRGQGILVYVMAPKQGLLKLRLTNEQRVREKKQKDKKEKKDERKQILLQQESQDEEDIYKNIRSMVNMEEQEEEEGKMNQQIEQNEQQLDMEIQKPKKEKIVVENSLDHPSSYYHALLLASPDSFQAHLKYITAMFQEKKAPHELRQQFVRSIEAMNTIQNKQNMWIVWINMQTILGNLVPTVKKALNQGASLKIYERVLEILVQQGKWDIAIELGKDMVKKQPTVKAWTKLIRAYYIIGKKKNLEQEASKKRIEQQIKRALLVLGAKQHVNLQCQYARILFTEGEAEQGRTIFQSLISKQPKRTDIWFVYIDTEAKYGEKQRVINLFQRGISLKLKQKKIQSFFKKYLKFMQDNNLDTGDVISKAKAYASSVNKIEEQQGEESQQEVNNDQN